MQRDPNLIHLSREHHTGLVLAKRARALPSADPTTRERGWAEIQTRFADELDPHLATGPGRRIGCIPGQQRLVAC